MTWKRNEVFSAIFARTGKSKRKRFAKRENKDHIMGSWENEVFQFWFGSWERAVHARELTL